MGGGKKTEIEERMKEQKQYILSIPYSVQEEKREKDELVCGKGSDGHTMDNVKVHTFEFFWEAGKSTVEQVGEEFF